MLQTKNNQDKQSSPPHNQNKKTMSLKIISLTNQKQNGESNFRKAKKVIRTLKIDTQPKIQDKMLIHQEFQNWLNKLHASKDSKNNKEKKSQQQLSERNKEAISTVYDLMRKDQKLAQCLPLTNKHDISVKGDTLKLNLQQVSNMRLKSSKKKVAIDQIYFQSQLDSKSSRCLGFRPLASRCPQRLVWNKKNVTSNSPKVNSVSFLSNSKKRTYTLQNLLQKTQTLQTQTIQKSSKSIFESPCRIGSYTSRSRQKICWQTIGLKEWINKAPKRNLYLSKC